MPSRENTHHHQYGLYTKTLCQLPTLTQFKICCIGVLTFGSLGKGSNPDPVTDPFSQQSSRNCEICLLRVSAHQVSHNVNGLLHFAAQHFVVQLLPPRHWISPKVTSHPAVRLGVQHAGTHPRTGYSLHTGTASPHSRTVSDLRCRSVQPQILMELSFPSVVLSMHLQRLSPATRARPELRMRLTGGLTLCCSTPVNMALHGCFSFNKFRTVVLKEVCTELSIGSKIALSANHQHNLEVFHVQD